MSDELNIRFSQPRGAGGRFLKTDPVQKAFIHMLMHEAAEDVLNFAEDQAKMNAPARTGNLKRSIGHQGIRRVGNVYMGELSIGVYYGKWVEEGTGIHGPFGTVIRPRVGNVLAWKQFNPMVGPGDERTVYAAWVRGQVGQHFIRRAYQAADRIYTPVRLQTLASQIRAVIES